MGNPRGIDELRDRVFQLLRAAGDDEPWVAIASDPYRGFRVRIVSKLFIGRSKADRRSLVLPDIDDDLLAYLDLLAPGEAEMLLGDAGITTDIELDRPSLPLWPESLARGQEQKMTVHLPSHTDEFLSAPLVATFYSLRGGVGRSTALTHTALLLAQSQRVLCIDMDLEAPGLAALLDIEHEVHPGQGVVPLLLAAEVGDNEPNVAEHLVQIDEEVELYLLPAGHPDADYARQLAQLEPAAWYREGRNPLRLLMDAVAKLRLSPQVVLIDARTGISPLSAPLLFDLADLAIVTFFPHPQARVGTKALTRALLAARSGRKSPAGSFTPEPRFLISPVPGAGAPEIRKRYEDRALAWVADWLKPASDSQGNPAFPDIEELVHVVGYSEDLATSDTARLYSSRDLFTPVAGWIAGFIPQSAGATVPDEVETVALSAKQRALQQLQFSAGTAEAQSDDEFEQTFLRTDVVERAMRDAIPLVIGRKGTGKTALFRKLTLELPRSVVVTSPPRLPTRRPWMPESEAYKAIGDRLTELKLDWRVAWPLIAGIALRVSIFGRTLPPWPGGALICDEKTAEKYSTSNFVSDVRSMLAVADTALVAWDWIGSMDEAIGDRTVLLFDGLDTGFGLTQADLARRRSAISGLLSFLGARGDDLANLRLKVMLREDLWRSVPLPNKSHFYGRDARLAWSDQVDYLKVAIKQALRSEVVLDLVKDRIGSMPVGVDISSGDVDLWAPAQVYDAWRLLVGERVSGGKTAFTYNWVWSRLSDANDSHAPRALLQLFHTAVALERKLYPASPYERSILRPRALVESLDAVSDEALQALEEEFSELSPLFEALRAIGRTPFPASDLDIDAGVENLGREVGVLGVELGTRDDVERYRVPELYRKALGMSRRGQA